MLSDALKTPIPVPSWCEIFRRPPARALGAADQTWKPSPASDGAAVSSPPQKNVDFPAYTVYIYIYTCKAYIGKEHTNIYQQRVPHNYVQALLVESMGFDMLQLEDSSTQRTDLLLFAALDL